MSRPKKTKFKHALIEDAGNALKITLYDDPDGKTQVCFTDLLKVAQQEEGYFILDILTHYPGAAEGPHAGKYSRVYVLETLDNMLETKVLHASCSESMLALEAGAKYGIVFVRTWEVFKQQLTDPEWFYQAHFELLRGVQLAFSSTHDADSHLKLFRTMQQHEQWYLNEARKAADVLQDWAEKKGEYDEKQ